MVRIQISLRRWMQRSPRPHAVILVSIGVLLLLALCVGLYDRYEDDWRTSPRNAELAVLPDMGDFDPDHETARIYVSLPGDGRILVDGRVVTLDQAERLLAAYVRAPWIPMERGGPDVPEAEEEPPFPESWEPPSSGVLRHRPVYLRANARVRWSEVRQVLRTAAEAGVNFVHIATRLPEKPRFAQSFRASIAAFPEEPPARALHAVRIRPDGYEFRERRYGGPAELAHALESVDRSSVLPPVFLRIDAAPDTRWERVVPVIHAANRTVSGLLVAP